MHLPLLEHAFGKSRVSDDLRRHDAHVTSFVVRPHFMKKCTMFNIHRYFNLFREAKDGIFSNSENT